MQYKKAEGMAVELLSEHAGARKTLLEKMSVIDRCPACEYLIPNLLLIQYLVYY